MASGNTHPTRSPELDPGHPDPSYPDLINQAHIARLAGVGRAAVANWRRRHDDFPAAVGGTDLSPEFDLGQVRAWLREHFGAVE